MKMWHIKHRNFRKNKKAMSPAISTIIVTAGVVVMIMVALSFASGFLDRRLAENEFSTNKQFMLSTAVNIDDIAWMPGKAQTVRYSSTYGSLTYENNSLRYTFTIAYTTGAPTVVSYDTAMILYNLPVSYYSLGNNYHQHLSPSSSSFMQVGATAPICHVFCVEKIPLDGDYLRIAVVPSIRVLNYTQGSNTTCVSIYLATLQESGSTYYSQSLSFSGKNILSPVDFSRKVANVTISVSYINSNGYNSSFFSFGSSSIVLNNAKGVYPTIINNSTYTTNVQIFIGQVLFSIGKV